MSWVGRIQNKRLAKDNIIVYKVFSVFVNEGILMSPIAKRQYTLGKLYNTEIHTEKYVPPYSVLGGGISSNVIIIKDGIHCLSNKCEFERITTSSSTLPKKYLQLRVWLKKPQYPYEQKGTDVYSCDDYTYPAVFKCIIPKGTTYYINRAGEIVTEALKIFQITDF